MKGQFRQFVVAAFTSSPVMGRNVHKYVWFVNLPTPGNLQNNKMIICCGEAETAVRCGSAIGWHGFAFIFLLHALLKQQRIRARQGCFFLKLIPHWFVLFQAKTDSLSHNLLTRCEVTWLLHDLCFEKQNYWLLNLFIIWACRLWPHYHHPHHVYLRPSVNWRRPCRR